MYKRLETFPLNRIKINDVFWNRYIHLVKDVLLPYQWDILNDRLEGVETSHCIQNFKVAAKEAEGNFYGAVFQDTDVAKWLEAVAYTLETKPDKELEALADEVIELIGRAQCEDGYLNTYFTIKAPKLRWTNLKEGHELYTAGHMIEAAVAYYHATGKCKFLDIVTKFADLICDVFGEEKDKCYGYPGHQEIELALVRLYHVTGKKRYIDLAKHFIDSRGVGENYFLEESKNPLYKQIFPEFGRYDTKYSQSHLPVREQTTAEGHAVRAVYMYCAMADLAWLYEDEGLLDTCKRLWEDMVKRRMYITGSIGSSGILERFTTDYDLPNNCNYSETCASIGLALFGRRMAQITRDASYMDVVELALYNTVLSGISLDGKSFFYVNPLEVWPANCMDYTSKEHVKPVRQPWFGVACCPPNIARTLASIGHYIYFTDKETLYVNLYISNKISIDGEGEQSGFSLDIKSDIAGSGHVKVYYSKAAEQSGIRRIAFRIPEYVHNYTITIGHENRILSGYTIEKGYLYIDVTEACEGIININFEIPAKFVRANPNVREDIGKVALVKGPLVYCLEEIDNGDNLASVFVDTSKNPEEIYDFQAKSYENFGYNKESFYKEFLGGAVPLRLAGKRLISKGFEDGSLYSESINSFEDTDIIAVPYHCWNNRKAGEMTVWIKELMQY